jgi:hypothetical protein
MKSESYHPAFMSDIPLPEKHAENTGLVTA